MPIDMPTNHQILAAIYAAIAANYEDYEPRLYDLRTVVMHVKYFHGEEASISISGQRTFLEVTFNFIKGAGKLFLDTKHIANIEQLGDTLEIEITLVKS